VECREGVVGVGAGGRISSGSEEGGRKQRVRRRGWRADWKRSRCVGARARGTYRAAKDQIAFAADGLRGLVQRFDIPLFSRVSGHSVLIDALGRYHEKHNAQVTEQLLVAETERRNAMEGSSMGRKSRYRPWTVDFPQGNAPSPYLESRPSSPITFSRNVAGFIAILQPLWARCHPPKLARRN
jgi:hypothetical protein